MALIEWQIHGTEFANCNRNWGCPDRFDRAPTADSCRALTFVQIDRGYFGDVSLDGLRWGICGSWPGPIHLGNGTFQSIIDERATPAQRAALEAISQGRETEPGTLIWQVFSTTVTKVLPPLMRPIDLLIDLAVGIARLNVPGIVEGVAGPIKDAVTNAAQRVHMSLSAGFGFSATEFDGAHAHIAQIHWGTHGLVRQ
jgi:hypothetical protein